MVAAEDLVARQNVALGGLAAQARGLGEARAELQRVADNDLRLLPPSQR